jgi:hypothetical protein
MQDIINFNRQTLSTVEQWILREDWAMPPSLFNYGLPAHVFDLIDKPIDYNVTEVDHLCHIMQTLAACSTDGLDQTKQTKPIRYLEIGVSVGKNLYTMTRFVQDFIAKSKTNKNKHVITGIDIEKINPMLCNLLEKSHGSFKVESFPNGNSCNSIRKNPLNFSNAFFDDVLLTTYYEADEFSDVWSTLDKESPFNLVFSDALHEPRALLHEYASLKENNLLDVSGGFFYCFDDLEADENTGSMWGAVHNIVADIKATYGTKLEVNMQHLEMNAWLGQHEGKHHFGVIKAFPRLLARKIL